MGTALDESRGDLLSPQELDALSELLRIALGAAESRLRSLLHAPLALQPATVSEAPPRVIVSALEKWLGEEHRVHVVRQAFRPNLRGEAYLVVDASDDAHLATLLSERRGEATVDALLLELANLVTGATLSRLGELLETPVTLGPPHIEVRDGAVYDLPTSEASHHQRAIVVRVDVVAQVAPVRAVLHLVIPAVATPALRACIQRWLDE